MNMWELWIFRRSPQALVLKALLASFVASFRSRVVSNSFVLPPTTQPAAPVTAILVGLLCPGAGRSIRSGSR
jgi:hypothetical protein